MLVGIAAACACANAHLTGEKVAGQEEENKMVFAVMKSSAKVNLF